MSESKLALSGMCLLFLAIVAVALCVSWVNIDEQHQLTTRSCIGVTHQVKDCVGLTEVP